ncbi:MAG TPA: hypothetical protein VN517_03685 [Terriglobales bacterium]|nr:hypothetical protein [Terriglobales bacterium]
MKLRPLQDRVTYRVLKQFREQIGSGYVDWYHLPLEERARSEYEAYSHANHQYGGSFLFAAERRVSALGHLRGRWYLAHRIAEWLQNYADSQPLKGK